MDLTLVIPTRNGALRLPALFAALEAQAESPDRPDFEVLVVDNNSDDSTPELAQAWAQRLAGRLDVRVLHEARPGTAWARDAGVAAARAPVIGFLDDDNRPRPGWVGAAVATFLGRPRVGLVGGRIHNRLPEEARPWIGPGNLFLGDVDYGPQRVRITGRTHHSLNGAGSVARRSAWRECISGRLRLAGRFGGHLIGGEDREAEARMAAAGWEVWYEPGLVIDHEIEARRCTEAYLLRLVHDAGLSRPVLRALWRQDEGWGGVAAGASLDAFRWAARRARPRQDFATRLWRAFHAGSVVGAWHFRHLLAELMADRLDLVRPPGNGRD